MTPARPLPLLRRAPAVATCLMMATVVACAARQSTSAASSGRKAGSCRPEQPCWPSAAEWQSLGQKLTGKLLQPRSPLAPCAEDFASAGCSRALQTLKNPYALQDDPGATESLGFLNAWDAAPSEYAVAAETPQDIALGVRFARDHDLKLVVKGTGHDYLGRSSAPRSMLLWTHQMRRISVQDAFVPAGCPASTPASPAITVEAGVRWLEAYQAAGKHGRYVPGGGCTSVGAAGGFLQGGGFGPWSNAYGISAAGLLEAQVVTADGVLRFANACQNADLFWALKGGGGGTFGVVTQVTLLTHPAPANMGFAVGELKAKDDASYLELLRRFFAFYRSDLMGPTWGEHVTVRPRNTIELTLSFVGLTGEEARQRLDPLVDALRKEPDRFTASLQVLAVPGDKVWDRAYAEEHVAFAIQPDTRPGADALWWWKSNQGEVATYWYTYQSRWLPKALFAADSVDRLAKLLFDASRHWPLEIYFSKGQASAAEDALRRGRETSINPVVFDATALVIAGANGAGSNEVPGHHPDASEGADEKARVTAAMDVIRAATPDSGSYVNETDYFEPDWQRSFWGKNYARLLEIKRRYDPDGLFRCHHCVGSEDLTR